MTPETDPHFCPKCDKWRCVCVRVYTLENALAEEPDEPTCEVCSLPTPSACACPPPDHRRCVLCNQRQCVCTPAEVYEFFAKRRKLRDRPRPVRLTPAQIEERRLRADRDRVRAEATAIRLLSLLPTPEEMHAERRAIEQRELIRSLADYMDITLEQAGAILAKAEQFSKGGSQC